MLLGKALLAAAEPSFRAATTVGNPRKAAQWNVFPAEQVHSCSVMNIFILCRRTTYLLSKVGYLFKAGNDECEQSQQESLGLCRACMEASI